MSGTAAAFDDRPLKLALDGARQRTARVIPDAEWTLFAPTIERVLELKRERHALILAHNYQRPEIFHGIADVTGDSLALARAAARTDAPVIVMCGVHFMAETAKLLNPEKTVLLPDLEAGCSLAASITADDVRALKREHPGVPVVTYVNTSAAVKAESDVCCTSANAVEVVRRLASERVIFLPDEYLGHYVAQQLRCEVILASGRCEVHERFTGEEIRRFREESEGLYVIAHPECAPDVLAAADFVGSTSAMVAELRTRRPRRVAMITECSMADNVASELPEVEFVKPCHLCPHMARISLENVAQALELGRHVIDVPAEIAPRARRAVLRMLDVAGRA